ncbi:unnamed protein product, partial [marine sediment metagenome]
ILKAEKSMAMPRRMVFSTQRLGRMKMKMVQYARACEWVGRVTIGVPTDGTWQKLNGFTSTTLLPFGTLFLSIQNVKINCGLLHGTLRLTLRW